MRGSKTILITAALFAAPAAWTQDPIQTLPKNYRVEFENRWVRVVHVHYAAKEILPQHDHPKTPTLYVYLSDAGPVRFKHTGANPYALDRPAVKPGGFRLNPGVLEEHEVENISSTPSDFLRVEFKTIPFKRTTLRGHFPPASADFWKTEERRQVVFEDQNIRITRLGYRQGATGTLPAAIERNAIDIAVGGREVRLGRARKSLYPGEVWAAPDRSTRIENTGMENVEILRSELKPGA
jgi:hypothetical protein